MPTNTQSQEEFENSLIITSKTVLENILSQEKSIDAIGVYMFYLYTAKWQKTWQLKATTNYVQNGLKLSKARVIEAKKILTSLGLIEDYQRKSKDGKVTGHYIKLLYPCNILSTLDESQPVVNHDTNAYNTNTLNAYNTNKENAYQSSNEVDENKDIISLPVQEELTIPVQASNKTSSARLYKLYGVMWQNKYGVKQKYNFAIDLSILKKISSQLGEYRTAIVIIMFMSWKGASGSDKFIENMLKNSCHDLKYLPKQVTPILAYVKNVLGIDTDNESEIIKVVDKTLKDIKIYDK